MAFSIYPLAGALQNTTVSFFFEQKYKVKEVLIFQASFWGSRKYGLTKSQSVQEVFLNFTLNVDFYQYTPNTYPKHWDV